MVKLSFVREQLAGKRLKGEIFLSEEIKPRSLPRVADMACAYLADVCVSPVPAITDVDRLNSFMESIVAMEPDRTERFSTDRKMLILGKAYFDEATGEYVDRLVTYVDRATAYSYDRRYVYPVFRRLVVTCYPTEETAKRAMKAIKEGRPSHLHSFLYHGDYNGHRISG